MRFDTPVTQRLGRSEFLHDIKPLRRPVVPYQGSSSAISLLTAHQIGMQINRPPKALMFFKWRAAHVGQTTYQFLWLDHQCRWWLCHRRCGRNRAYCCVAESFVTLGLPGVARLSKIFCRRTGSKLATLASFTRGAELMWSFAICKAELLRFHQWGAAYDSNTLLENRHVPRGL